MYFCKMGETTDYSKLRLDVLQKLIQQRGIDCKNKKDEMVRLLKLDDEGKYVEPIGEILYEKCDGGFNVGIDLKRHADLVQIGKLVEKKEAKCLNRYSDNRIWYWSKMKLI